MPPVNQETPEHDLTPSDAAYLDKVRRATTRLATHEVAPDDVRAALEAVRDVAAFNVEVPTDSPRREVHLAKQAFKRAAAWYLRYLAEQLNAFAGAALRLGETLVTRVEGAEVRLDELAARVEVLEKSSLSSAVPTPVPAVPNRAAAAPTPGSQELPAPGRRARPSQGESGGPSGRPSKGQGVGSGNRTRQGQGSLTRQGQGGGRGASQGQAHGKGTRREG